MKTVTQLSEFIFLTANNLYSATRRASLYVIVCTVVTLLLPTQCSIYNVPRPDISCYAQALPKWFGSDVNHRNKLRRVVNLETSIRRRFAPAECLFRWFTSRLLPTQCSIYNVHRHFLLVCVRAEYGRNGFLILRPFLRLVSGFHIFKFQNNGFMHLVDPFYIFNH